jgi:hypothetical protein
MSHLRWFENVRLNKTTKAATRRDVVRAVASIFPGLALGGLVEIALGKPDRKRNRKPKSNGRDRPGTGQDDDGLAAAAAGDACSANWPGSGRRARRNRRHCRFIRRQCDGDDPRDFCIVQVLPTDDKIADCCPDGRPKCCGRECCQSNDKCCEGRCCGDASSPELQCCNGRCINTNANFLHCGGCGHECPVGQTCADGRCVCVGGPCDPACPVGLTYCDGECVDTLEDPRHCGGCNAFNPNGLKCCNGNLCTYVDGLCCGSTCYPSYYTSCP